MSTKLSPAMWTIALVILGNKYLATLAQKQVITEAIHPPCKVLSHEFPNIVAFKYLADDQLPGDFQMNSKMISKLLITQTKPMGP